MDAAASGTVLHADLDSFFASVEVRDNPRLRGRPVIVGGGVVLAATYEAKARGVRTAMGGRQAKALCPDAIFVPARFSAYTEASRAVFEVFRDTTPLVEGISIDEAFLEVGGLLRLRGQTPAQIASQLRDDVRDRVGLPISVGVARTKYLAKIASASAKPDGLLVVPVNAELLFLHALPVERLWGVGKVTAAKLHAAGITTVGQMARLELIDMEGLLGKGTGRHLHALARGDDPRRVRTGVRRGSMGAQHALGSGPHTEELLHTVLLGLVDKVARRLRNAGRTGATVTLRLRFGDFTRSTSSRTLTRPTAHTGELLDVAHALLRSRHQDIAERGCTLVGVSIGGLDDNPLQLLLPLDVTDTPSLDDTIDAVRNKFGAAAVKRAVQLGHRQRDPQPILPD